MQEGNLVILSLGSNIGNREEYIQSAVHKLEVVFEARVIRSSLYESQPWGFDAKTAFLNCCVGLYTIKNPEEVLEVTQVIETDLGRERVRKSKMEGKRVAYQSRTIDIDILYIGQLIVNTEGLVIPHPLLYFRNFVLVPLAEIYPEFMDPVKKKRVLSLKESCNDKNNVLLYMK